MLDDKEQALLKDKYHIVGWNYDLVFLEALNFY